MAAKFGTSGLRGLVQELLGEPARSHVRAFVRHLRNAHGLQAGKPVMVGWDFRDSSPELAADVVAALRTEGHEPVLCGHIPTPVLALHAIAAGLPSIMITGSHIPADRNGLKFFLPTGEITKHDEEQIAALAPRMPRTSLVVEAAGVAAGPARAEAISRFSARLRPLFASRPLTGWSVAVYQHSTVARDLLVDLLSEAGAKCARLGHSQSFIPVDTEAVSQETLHAIAGWCAEGKYDAVVSADGDADRPMVADAKGNLLRGDFLGLIAASVLNAEVIATPVTSNSGIESASGADVLRTRVGSPYVVEAMSRSVLNGRQGVVGFEANGGFLTATDCNSAAGRISALPTRDCFLPILAVLITAAARCQSLAGLQQSFRLPFAAAGRLQNFPAETAARLLTQLSQSTAAIESFLGRLGEVAGINNIDGLRIALRSGDIIHFRASGNAPEFRCYVESSESARATALLEHNLELVRVYAAASA